MPSPTELKTQGLQLFQADRLAEAADKFLEAAQAFTAEGDKGAAAEMMNNVGVVRLAEKNWEAALTAVQGTPEVFHELGDQMREAQAMSNLANAHDGAGRLDDAARLYERAIDLFAELGETENRAACWKALSGVQIKQGKQLQAVASMQAGLKLSPKLSAKEKAYKSVLDQAMKMIGGNTFA
jgi:tetratricopeptide (TPR) repeat protein